MKILRYILFPIIYLSIVLFSFQVCAASKQTVPNGVPTVLQDGLKVLGQYESQIKSVNERLTSEPPLSINGLNIKRSQVLYIQDAIKKQAELYQAQLKKIQAITTEFDKIKSDNVKGKTEATLDYDKYYKNKIDAFLSQITYYQNRIFQIHLMQYDIDLTLNKIKKQQINLRNGTIWAVSNQLYFVNTWKKAFYGYYTYSKRFIKQFADAYQLVITTFHDIKSWVYLSIIMILLGLSIKFLWLKNFELVFSDVGNRALSYLTVRGVVPAIFCLVGVKIVTVIFSNSALIIAFGFLKSLLQILALWFILSSVIAIVFKYLLPENIKNECTNLKSPIGWSKNFILLILFINNINPFCLDSFPYPFYPSSSVAIINLVLAVLLAGCFVVLVRKVKQICKESLCD